VLSNPPPTATYILAIVREKELALSGMSNGEGTVDFTVVPSEDLFLSHGTKRRKRVSKGELAMQYFIP
jgi:hypothetical protein